MEPTIEFISEYEGFELQHAEDVRQWLVELVGHHGKTIDELTYVFVNDEHLAEMNLQVLDHDTYTDILTFPLHDPDTDRIMGDIFISVDRVKENSETFGTGFVDELHRVISHGALHLVGMDDLDDESEAAMRAAEDYALSLRRFG